MKITICIGNYKRICVDGKSQAFEAEVNNFKCCEEVLFQKIWAVSVHMRRKQQHLFHKNGAWLLHAVFACDRLRPYDPYRSAVPYSSAVKRRFADLSFSRAPVKSWKECARTRSHCDVDAYDVVDVDEYEAEVNEENAPYAHVEKLDDSHLVLDDADVVEDSKHDVDKKDTQAIEHGGIGEHNDANGLQNPEKESNAPKHDNFGAGERTRGIEKERKRQREEE